MSNSEVAPIAVELLDALTPHAPYPSYPSNQTRPFNPRKFSLGELYGCVCHRPFDELPPSANGWDTDSGLERDEQALKIARWNQRSTSEAPQEGVTRI
ncbi:MAG TPA: hypothetical protein VHK27_03560 [Gammaproteobacteria bacterium]|nr:hypothetical protein [Gammaproteobacteria bacterium]